MIRVLTFLLVFTAQVFAFDGTYRSENKITLDSTATGYLYYSFKAEGFWSKSGLHTSAFTPPGEIVSSSDILVSGYLDSLLASGHTDSVSVYLVALNSKGYLLPDTTWIDFANNDTSATQKWLDFTPWNEGSRTLASSSPTFWARLTGISKEYFGFKVVVQQATKGQNSKTRFTIVIDARR